MAPWDWPQPETGMAGLGAAGPAGQGLARVPHCQLQLPRPSSPDLVMRPWPGWEVAQVGKLSKTHLELKPERRDVAVLIPPTLQGQGPGPYAQPASGAPKR